MRVVSELRANSEWLKGCCPLFSFAFTIRYSTIRDALKALAANWRTFVLPKMLMGLAPATARALVDLHRGQSGFACAIGGSLSLNPARLKFACRIKTAHCKYNEFATPEKFRVQRQRDAPRMTANNNEHQCRRQRPGPSTVGAALVATLLLPSQRAPTRGAPTHAAHNFESRRTNQTKARRGSHPGANWRNP